MDVQILTINLCSEEVHVFVEAIADVHRCRVESIALSSDLVYLIDAS